MEAPPTPSKRSFRDRVDDHPIGLLLGVAVAAVTATLAVVVPIVQLTQDNRVSAVQSQMQQDRTEHAAAIAALQAQLDDAQRQADQQLADARAASQARIDELDRSLSSIQRSLGSDSEYFDVSTLVVDPADVGSLPATSTFFSDDRFYGLDATAATGWTYQVTSELQLTAELFGIPEEQIRANATARQIDLATRFPVHVWRFGDDRQLSFVDPATGRSVELHPRTLAWVQRVSQADYLSLIQGTLASPQPSGSTLGESVRDGFESDPAGWVLQDELLTEIAAGSLRPRIESLQKRNDLAYARVETVLPNVHLRDQAFAEYYWDREWFIVQTARDLYLVKLYVADDDHRSPDYGALTTWLDQLRILAS